MNTTAIPATRLQAIATDHISYEVTTLLDEVQQADRILAQLRGDTRDIAARALLEASLVHIRLLDEFFRSQLPSTPARSEGRLGQLRRRVTLYLGRRDGRTATEDDITAQHYYPGWQPSGFLTRKERKAVNAQLQHLAERRQAGYQWNLGKHTQSACKAFVRFVDQLRRADPGRAQWFDAACQAARAAIAAQPPLLSMRQSATTTTTHITVQGGIRSPKPKNDPP